MFNITIQPILDKLNSELVIGYLGDITLGGGVHQVAADIEIVVKDAEAMGLILNTNKCELISFESKNIPPITTFDNYQLIKPNDAILLGVPILPGPAVDISLKSKFDTFKQAIKRMQHIDAHDALLLKSSLHLPKLLYILSIRLYAKGTPYSVTSTISLEGVCQTFLICRFLTTVVKRIFQSLMVARV